MQTKTQTALWRKKPWVGFVFLTIGMGFGVNVWAVCEAERDIALTSAASLGVRTAIQTEYDFYISPKLWEQATKQDVRMNYEQFLLEREQNKKSPILNKPEFITRHEATICLMKWRLDGGAPPNSNLSQNGSTSNTQNAQSNPLQSETQQSQQRARDNQARADQDAQRKGKRSHDPAAEAHECVDVDASGSYGGLVNKCNYPIEVQYCNFRPKKDSWAAQLECGKSGGLTTVGAGRTSANHVKNTETVFFFACKKPALPSDVTYVEGKGLSGRCR